MDRGPEEKSYWTGAWWLCIYIELPQLGKCFCPCYRYYWFCVRANGIRLEHTFVGHINKAQFRWHALHIRSTLLCLVHKLFWSAGVLSAEKKLFSFRKNWRMIYWETLKRRLLLSILFRLDFNVHRIWVFFFFFVFGLMLCSLCARNESISCGFAQSFDLIWWDLADIEGNDGWSWCHCVGWGGGCWPRPSLGLCRERILWIVWRLNYG